MRWIVLAVALLVFILVPFAVFESEMSAWSEALLDSGQSKPILAVGIAALLASDVFLPVPSSVVSTAAGYLLGLVPAILVSWGGLTAGCGLGYFAGMRAAGASAGRLVTESDLARVASAAVRSR